MQQCHGQAFRTWYLGNGERAFAAFLLALRLGTFLHLVVDAADSRGDIALAYLVLDLGVVPLLFRAARFLAESFFGS